MKKHNHLVPRRRTWDTRPPTYLTPPPPIPTTQLHARAHIRILSSSRSLLFSPHQRIDQASKQTSPPKPKRQKTKQRTKRDTGMHTLTLPQSLVNQLLPLHRPLPLEKRRRHAYRYVTAVRIVVRARHRDVVRLEGRGYLRPAGVDYARRR